jgi:3',5'-cyclic AMP phosphodiesterase CpdA
MKSRNPLCLVFTLAILTILPAIAVQAQAADDFRVPPYLQNPRPDGITIVWFSESAAPGRLSYVSPAGDEEAIESTPILAETLAYLSQESGFFENNQPPPPPYRHTVTITGLTPGTSYAYAVQQGASRFASSFATAPDANSPVRLIIFGDSETEPESTGARCAWADPNGSPTRPYLLDQTQGFANNIEVIASRQPDLVAIAGDLVESGGEQRDWDEFWLHVTDIDGNESLAGRVPFLAAPGNHEYYAGIGGRYNQPFSERAINRFRTYFEFPRNNAPDPEQEGRYFRLDYGPLTLIGLDVANDSPSQTDRDTNFFLLGESDSGGGHAPAFGPGSRQYAWLEEQLEEAQRVSRFTFVFFHHGPYSVGPHGYDPGPGTGPPRDSQSGVPVRALTPLFMRFGVDAVFAGHDEMFERSEIEGMEVLPDGTDRPHVIQFYDVGVGGDGLRGPEEELENPHQRFLAHSDAPEIWENDILVDGGKHYGHLEVNVVPLGQGRWEALLTPVYVFPLMSSDGAIDKFERRVYDDVIRLTSGVVPTAVKDDQLLSGPRTFHLQQNSPNPFNSNTVISFELQRPQVIDLSIFNLAGQRIATVSRGQRVAGSHVLQWKALGDDGRALSSGVYLYRLKTEDGAMQTRRLLFLK